MENIQNTQEWLEQKYPKGKRRKEEFLNISGKRLNSSLRVEGFINLKTLKCNNNNLDSLFVTNCPKLTSIDCSNNRLTFFKISLCPNLTEIRCANNLLTKTDFSRLEPEKLKFIDLNNNNFSQKDLSFLAELTNLEKLQIGRNNFNGSLIHLRNMKKLKHLDMNDNNFTSGLEYLPIELSGSHLISILAPFNYNLKKWREENVELTAKTKPEFQKLNQKIE